MKDRKIERDTNYQYNEKGELCGMTIHETVTNPICEECGCIDDAELMTGELDVAAEMSIWEVILAAAAGVVVGNLLCRIISKD